MDTTTAVRVGATGTAVKIRPCVCQSVLARVGIEQAAQVPSKHKHFITELDAETGYATLETGCTGVTTKTFAPGHDARLVGLLQTAQRLGGEASITSGGVSIPYEPAQLATEIGMSDHLVDKVRFGGSVKKTGDKATKPAPVQAKVGRWTYTGTVQSGEFTYVTAKGETKTTSKYTLVA